MPADAAATTASADAALRADGASTSLLPSPPLPSAPPRPAPRPAAIPSAAAAGRIAAVVDGLVAAAAAAGITVEALTLSVMPPWERGGEGAG